jgi:hypothetical protein
VSDFWSQYEKSVESESGGGGIICRAKIETVYKGFVPGLDQGDAYRAVGVNATDNEKNKAKAELTALGADRAQYGVQIRAYRDSAVSRGKPVTWTTDRFFFQASWNSACKDVVVPSIRDSGIASLPYEGWVRIGFKPNPFNVAQGEAGKTDKDQEGNPRFPQVAYVTEVFANEDAARAAIGGEASEAQTSTSGNAPAGWGVAEWQNIWPVIHGQKQDGKTPKEIADYFGVTVPDVTKALAEYVPL